MDYPAWSLVGSLQDLRLAVGPASYLLPHVRVLDTLKKWYVMPVLKQLDQALILQKSRKRFYVDTSATVKIIPGREAKVSQ